jgi:hypothetical protein
MQPCTSASLARFATAQSTWPLEWARGLLQHQGFAQRRVLALAEQPSADTAAGLIDAVSLWQASGVAAPFDLARAQYAAGVQAGLIERSLLASSAFERGLDALERLALGPWARTV